MMEGIGQAIGCLVTIAIVGVIGVILLGGYLTFDLVKEDILESKKRLIPEIRLTTDGKKVDTLYIYKLK
jgi:uncharacterized protein YpmB